jgi:hypothetical protein
MRRGPSRARRIQPAFMECGLATVSISIQVVSCQLADARGQEISVVIRRRHMLVMAGLLLCCAVLVSLLAPARTVVAQETCAARCLDAYTACYVRTKNRNQCEQVRESCIRQCQRR